MKFTRSLNIREAASNDDSSIAISFSSETPFLRLMGGKPMYEVLSHDPAHIDMSRAQQGLALLWNHDKSIQVGRAENIGIDPVERKGIATIRFGSGEKARELQADVANNIVQEISCGYQVRNYEVIPPKVKGDYPTALVTDWLPFEISLVACPADSLVGVGRGMDTMDPKACPECGAEMEDACPTCGAPKTTSETEPEVEVEVTVNVVVDNSEVPETQEVEAPETPETQDNTKACTTTETKSFSHEVTSMDELTPTTAPVTMPQAPTKSFEQRDMKGYSLGRAINGILTGKLTGLEAEVGQEMLTRGFAETTIPTEAFRTDPVPAFAFGNSHAGSDMNVPAFGSYLELLLTGSSLNRLGVPVMNLTQPTVFPALDSVPEPTEQAEVDAVGTPGQFVTRQVTFTPQILVSGFGVSRTALMHSPASLDSYLKTAIMRKHIQAFDKKAIAKLVSQMTGTVVGDTDEIAKYVALVTKVQDVTDYNSGCAFLTTNALLNSLKLVKRDATLNTPVATDNSILDWKAVSTSNISKISLGGTPETFTDPLVYGDWGYAAFASFGGGVNIVTDIYGANAYSDSVSLVAQAHWDAEVMNKQAFAKLVPA